MKPARSNSSAVAQFVNLLFRRMAFGKPSKRPARTNFQTRRQPLRGRARHSVRAALPTEALLSCLAALTFAAAFSLQAQIREAPPGIQQGTPLDVSSWTFRKPVLITRPGLQQLELDPDVLSHAQPDFADLRLMLDGNQISYILEHTTIQRSLTPQVSVTNDTQDPKVSRWILKLPHPALPINRLACSTRTALFQREMTAYENLRDERGEPYQHILGRASWKHTSSWFNKDFSLAFDGAPQSDTIILETHNGDNPPIELENFQLFYAATRVLFKANPGDKLFLYYGNPGANPPQYDLSLISNEVLAASKADAALGAEERLKNPWPRELQTGKSAVFFWAILSLVVLTLLVVIAKLLPKSDG